jgi:hypothetical protein
LALGFPKSRAKRENPIAATTSGNRNSTQFT